MKKYSTAEYTLYKLMTDDKILVAVPKAYSDQITSLVERYGSLEKIPASKTVRGVFIPKKLTDTLEKLDGNEIQNDVTINQLKLHSKD